MEIVLGIFEMAKIEEFARQHGYLDYPFDEISRRQNTVLEMVKVACSRAIKIHFHLDGLKVPLSVASITCEKLSFVLSHKRILEKTIFYYKWKELSVKQRENFLKKVDMAGELPRQVRITSSFLNMQHEKVSS